MLLSLRKNGLTSLFKEVRVFKVFLKLFEHPRDIPLKIPGYPAKKFGFPGFEGHMDFFGPHPFMGKTTTPPEDIRTKMFGFGFFFLA